MKRYYLSNIYLIFFCFLFLYSGKPNPFPTVVAKYPKVSFQEAKRFMEKRCKNINQSYVEGKAVTLPEGEVYAFLSQGIRYPNKFCVSMVNAHTLDVQAVDCGGNEKVEQFKAI